MAEEAATTATEVSPPNPEAEKQVEPDSKVEKGNENKIEEIKEVSSDGDKKPKEDVVEENGKNEKEPAKPEVENEEDEPVPAKKRENNAINKTSAESLKTSEDRRESAEEQNQDLDDDQQVENPAYIPKLGRFYMHDDDRRGDNDRSGQVDSDEGREEKKRSRADGMWKHDRFDETLQRPKSKKQLVTRYGFDIRRNSKEDEKEDSADKDTVPESTEEDSDARNIKKKRETRKPSSRGALRNGPANRNRRPMKQREREDTVDDSEEKRDEERPAPRRQAPPLRNERQTVKKVTTKDQSRSSEEGDDDEEEAGLRRGQRRANPSLRRGFTGSRLRGRISTAPPRRHNGSRQDLHRESGSSRVSTQNQSQYQTRDRVPTSSTSSRLPPSDFSKRGARVGGNDVRSTQRRNYHRDSDDRNIVDDRFENHRRGVIRGAGVTRGSTRGYSSSRGGPSRGPVRTGRYSQNGPLSKEDNPTPSEAYGRKPAPEAQKVPTHVPPQTATASRGSYARGGAAMSSAPPPPVQNLSNNNRVAYHSNGGGDYNRGGGYQQKRGYHGPLVHGSMPPMVAVGVVPTNVPPPQITRGTTHGHHNHNNHHHHQNSQAPQGQQHQQQRIRQPTDVVYFDPVQQQQGNRQPPPSRAKKVIPIVDPNNKQ